MKKYLLLTILFFTLSFAAPSLIFAQGMPALHFAKGNSAWMENMLGRNRIMPESNGHTAREEAEGKELWEKLSARGAAPAGGQGSASGGQAEQITCTDLTDENFGALGEYFMGQMMGAAHEAMNNRLIQMLGEPGEEQMHIAMGKRMSGCEPNAPMPQKMIGGDMTSMMMNMMMGGGENSMMGMGNFGANSMSWSGFGFGWIFMVLFWILVILGIIALIKWLMIQGGDKTQEKSAMDILKERYAKGEIGKKEFEEKKKDLI